MPDIITPELIKQAKGLKEHFDDMSPIVELWRDDHLVCTLLFHDLDRAAIIEANATLCLMLSATDTITFLDARFRTIKDPSELETMERGDIANDPRNKEVLIVQQAKRYTGCEIIGLIYETDDEGKITWKETWNGEDDAIPPFVESHFLEAAQHGLSQPLFPGDDIIEAANRFGLSEAEARVRTDCAAIKMFASKFPTFSLMMGKYNDEVLDQHIQDSFSMPVSNN